MISLDDFQKIDVRVCTIVAAERMPDSDKLLKLAVDCGEDAARTIVSGIAAFVSPEELLGTQSPFILNLEPRTIRGERSEGMILAASAADGGFALLRPTRALPAGSRVR